MLSERALFSCGKMELNGKSVIVVAGGDWGTSILDTVEILDPSDGEGWVWGKVFTFDHPRFQFEIGLFKSYLGTKWHSKISLNQLLFKLRIKS